MAILDQKWSALHSIKVNPLERPVVDLGY